MFIDLTMLLFIEKGMFSSCLQPGAVSTIVSSVVNCGHICASTACSWHSAIATHSSSIAGRWPHPPRRPIAGSQNIRLLRACHLFNKITSNMHNETTSTKQLLERTATTIRMHELSYCAFVDIRKRNFHGE